MQNPVSTACKPGERMELENRARTQTGEVGPARAPADWSLRGYLKELPGRSIEDQSGGAAVLFGNRFLTWEDLHQWLTSDVPSGADCFGDTSLRK